MSKVDFIYKIKDHLEETMFERIETENYFLAKYSDSLDDRFLKTADSIADQISKIKDNINNFDELLIYIHELGGDISRSDLS